MLDPQAAPDLRPPSATSHRRILTSAALLAAMTVVVKLTAFAKDWLVARSFGASDQLDAFLIAVLVPSFVIGVVVHSFAAGFIPTYIRVLERDGQHSAARLVAGVLAAASAALAVLTLVVTLGGPLAISWLGTGFDATKLELSVSLFYVVVGIILVNGISGVLAAVLDARERFAVTATAALAVPLATFTALLLFAPRFGVYALAVGTLAGFAAESRCWSPALAPRSLAMAAARGPRRRLARQPAARGTAIPPAALAALLTSTSLVVDQSLAASLSSGNVSVLMYGNKVVALVIAIVAVNLSTVLFPKFSRLIVAREWDALERMMATYAAAILAIGIPAAMALAYFSEPIVRLLFERGAFTTETTHDVAAVQFWYTAQLPFAVLVMLGYRLLASLEGNRLVLAIGAVNLVLNVVGDVVLMHYFGVRGIAMATSIVFLVATALTYVAIRLKLAAARA